MESSKNYSQLAEVKGLQEGNCNICAIIKYIREPKAINKGYSLFFSITDPSINNEYFSKVKCLFWFTNRSQIDRFKLYSIIQIHRTKITNFNGLVQLQNGPATKFLIFDNDLDSDFNPMAHNYSKKVILSVVQIDKIKELRQWFDVSKNIIMEKECHQSINTSPVSSKTVACSSSLKEIGGYTSSEELRTSTSSNRLGTSTSSYTEMIECISTNNKQVNVKYSKLYELIQDHKSKHNVLAFIKNVDQIKQYKKKYQLSFSIIDDSLNDKFTNEIYCEYINKNLTILSHFKSGTIIQLYNVQINSEYGKIQFHLLDDLSWFLYNNNVNASTQPYASSSMQSVVTEANDQKESIKEKYLGKIIKNDYQDGNFENNVHECINKAIARLLELDNTVDNYDIDLSQLSSKFGSQPFNDTQKLVTESVPVHQQSSSHMNDRIHENINLKQIDTLLDEYSDEQEQINAQLDEFIDEPEQVSTLLNDEKFIHESKPNQKAVCSIENSITKFNNEQEISIETKQFPHAPICNPQQIIHHNEIIIPAEKAYTYVSISDKNASCEVDKFYSNFKKIPNSPESEINMNSIKDKELRKRGNSNIDITSKIRLLEERDSSIIVEKNEYINNFVLNNKNNFFNSYRDNIIIYNNKNNDNNNNDNNIKNKDNNKIQDNNNKQVLTQNEVITHEKVSNEEENNIGEKLRAHNKSISKNQVINFKKGKISDAQNNTKISLQDDYDYSNKIKAGSMFKNIATTSEYDFNKVPLIEKESTESISLYKNVKINSASMLSLLKKDEANIISKFEKDEANVMSNLEKDDVNIVFYGSTLVSYNKKCDANMITYHKKVDSGMVFYNKKDGAKLVSYQRKDDANMLSYDEKVNSGILSHDKDNKKNGLDRNILNTIRKSTINVMGFKNIKNLETSHVRQSFTIGDEWLLRLENDVPVKKNEMINNLESDDKNVKLSRPNVSSSEHAGQNRIENKSPDMSDEKQVIDLIEHYITECIEESGENITLILIKSPDDEQRLSKIIGKSVKLSLAPLNYLVTIKPPIKFLTHVQFINYIPIYCDPENIVRLLCRKCFLVSKINCQYLKGYCPKGFCVCRINPSYFRGNLPIYPCPRCSANKENTLIKGKIVIYLEYVFFMQVVLKDETGELMACLFADHAKAFFNNITPEDILRDRNKFRFVKAIFNELKRRQIKFHCCIRSFPYTEKRDISYEMFNIKLLPSFLESVKISA